MIQRLAGKLDKYVLGSDLEKLKELLLDAKGNFSIIYKDYHNNTVKVKHLYRSEFQEILRKGRFITWCYSNTVNQRVVKLKDCVIRKQLSYPIKGALAFETKLDAKVDFKERIKKFDLI